MSTCGTFFFATKNIKTISILETFYTFATTNVTQNSKLLQSIMQQSYPNQATFSNKHKIKTYKTSNI